jgi:hypothetical protein
MVAHVGNTALVARCNCCLWVSLHQQASLLRVPQHTLGATNPAGGSTLPLPYALQLVPHVKPHDS